MEKYTVSGELQVKQARFTPRKNYLQCRNKTTTIKHRTRQTI